MNDLTEKLTAIREDLVALESQGKLQDAKKLADLVIQKAPLLERNYDALRPYMSDEQRSRATWPSLLVGMAEVYLETGKDDLTRMVTKMVPPMLADLDDIERKIQNNAAPSPKTGAAT